MTSAIILFDNPMVVGKRESISIKSSHEKSYHWLWFVPIIVGGRMTKVLLSNSVISLTHSNVMNSSPRGFHPDNESLDITHFGIVA